MRFLIVYFQIGIFTEAAKACKFTRDTSIIGTNSTTEGDQLIARLKDYIDRIQKASREKAQERV